jgi:hypothetical protein
MRKLTIAFTRADLETQQYVGDDIEMSGTDKADGARVRARLDEADAMLVTQIVLDQDSAEVKISARQIAHRWPLRRAVIERVQGRPEPERVAPYLFGNFRVDAADDNQIVIAGWDNAGFTLEAQCDRLASGIIAAKVVA